MQKFRSKPFEVEAVQFTGTGDSCTEVGDFLGDAIHQWKTCTNEGGHVAAHDGLYEFSVGDWLVKKTNGEIGIFPNELFETKYELISE